MLVDLMGHEDQAESDPLVHLDGIEERPDGEERMDGKLSPFGLSS